MISRATVVNGLLALYESPSYLEIGVNRGETFFAAEAAKKVAVDPDFLFDFAARQRQETQSAYHQVTSDVFFCDIVSPDERFDVIFLDGLHQAEQTLRDFNNALEHLRPNGVILIDDVIPNSYHASLRSMEVAYALKDWLGSEDNSWMGDIYKLVAVIQAFYPQYSLRTISDNHGQAVVWRKRRRSDQIAEMTIEKIARLPFESVVFGRDMFELHPFADILQQLSDTLQRQDQ